MKATLIEYVPCAPVQDLYMTWARKQKPGRAAMIVHDQDYRDWVHCAKQAPHISIFPSSDVSHVSSKRISKLIICDAPDCLTIVKRFRFAEVLYLHLELTELPEEVKTITFTDRGRLLSDGSIVVSK